MKSLAHKCVLLSIGPQDHGWCAGYTCQKRVSLFHSIIATNHSFDVFFSSVSPQKLRLMMLNADPSEVSVQTNHTFRADVLTFNSMSPAIEITVKHFFCCLLCDCFVLFFISLQSILVSVFYSKPQRLDVYTNNVLIAPTNAGWNAANTDYTLRKPTYSGSDAELMTGTEHKA